MPTNLTATEKMAKLRKHAKARMTSEINNIADLSLEEIQTVVHDLHTHQIELEIQNEELRNTQAELEESYHRYTDLYDFAPVGYLTINEKGLILEANLTIARMLGVKRGDLVNQPLSAFIVTEDQDIYYHCRNKLLDTKNQQTCRLRMQKKGGNLFYAQLQSVINSEVENRLNQFRTVITDITEERRLEQNLLQSKKEWQDTFDAMNDIITLLDRDLRIIRANKAAHDFFKVKPGELNGQFCYKVFRGDTTPCNKCPMVKTIHATYDHCFETIEHKNLGKLFHVSSFPIIDEKGELQNLVHIAKDITEVKRLQEELFQSHKMEAIGTLAGGIAHDFNNILMAILGYAEMIKVDISDSSHLLNYIDQVIIAGNRATELVKQILTFSRKRQNQQREPLFPQHVVKEVLKMLRASLPTTIVIKEDIDPSCDAILADPTQLHQIIVNLCTNAFHSIENEQGTITVQLSTKSINSIEVSREVDQPSGPYVELVVKDTGKGMDKTLLGHIFDPYFTTKGFGKGSGIGLAVVHGIVNGYDGFIKVESAAGIGSTFKLYFPATVKQKQEKEEKVKKTLPPGNERILVVDDEENIVSFLEASLSRLGYKVITHTRSIEALEDFCSRPNEIDLVITDQAMPNMPGSELSKELLKVRNDIPIILCTGFSSMISDQKAKKIGINRFVMKPFNITKIAKIVREVLDEQTL